MSFGAYDTGKLLLPLLRRMQQCRDVWVIAREFLHGVRVAVVPVASVAIGILLYWTVPQAQDLFLEVVGNRVGGLLFWVTFYIVVIGFWIVPVYYSARWILGRYNHLAHEVHAHAPIPVEPWVERLLPPLLATLCLFAILVGQWGAIVGSPRTGFTCSSGVDAADCLHNIETLFNDAIKNGNDKALGPNWPAISNAAMSGGLAGIATLVGLLLYTLVTVIAWALVGLSRTSEFLTRPLLDDPTSARWHLPARIGVWLGAVAVLYHMLPALLAAAGAASLEALAPLAFIVIAFLFLGSQESLVTGISQGDWTKYQEKIGDVAYNLAGAPGFILLIMMLLASPAIIYGLMRAKRRFAAVHGHGVSICLRMTVWLSILLLIVTDVVAICLIRLWWAPLTAEATSAFSLYDLMLLPLVTFGLVWAAWSKLIPRGGHDNRLAVAVAEPFEAFGGIFAILLALSMIAVLVIILVDPIWLTQHIYRAPLLPIVLGLWIPLLTLISLWSQQTRTPLLIGLVVLLGGSAWIFGDAYDIRTVRTAADTTSVRPSLDDSIVRWAKVNQCDLPAKAGAAAVVARRCPSPLIALTSGGASRAAFMAVEVLGSLVNDSQDILAGTMKNPSEPPGDFRPFYNRLFAISGVSGGALAAVTYQATLADALLARGSTDTLRPPCAAPKGDGAAGDPLWYGAYAPIDASQTPDTAWNACMQLMIAGDFLSPAVVSLVGSDLVNIRPYGDRATTLERAWEHRFQHITDPSGTSRNAMAEPMIGLRNRVLAANERNWLPHLFLNGTSVATGRRIITSDLDPLPAIDAKGEPCREASGRAATGCTALFTDAYDLHDLMRYSNLPAAKASGGRPAVSVSGVDQTAVKAPAKSCDGCDIRLSTGATMSARFPVLSPHGTIRNADGGVADRVVDGGYFENNGAVTAQELAAALRARGLSPVILLITNEPTQTAMPCVVASAPLEHPRVGESTTMALLASPISALLGTRSARGTLASVELCKMIKAQMLTDGGLSPAGRFVHIGVDLDSDILGAKQLSMSWWLSKYVQRKLAWPKSLLEVMAPDQPPANAARVAPVASIAPAAPVAALSPSTTGAASDLDALAVLTATRTGLTASKQTLATREREVAALKVEASALRDRVRALEAASLEAASRAQPRADLQLQSQTVSLPRVNVSVDTGAAAGSATGASATPPAPPQQPVIRHASTCDAAVAGLGDTTILHFGRYQEILSVEHFRSLDQVAAFAAGCGRARIAITGFTDSRGERQNNDRLSSRRAEIAADYLKARRVAQARLDIRGRGSDMPLASNSSTDGRSMNRRVEILIRLDP